MRKLWNLFVGLFQPKNKPMMSDTELRLAITKVASITRKLKEESEAAEALTPTIIYEGALGTSQALLTNLKNIKKMREKKVDDFNGFTKNKTGK